MVMEDDLFCFVPSGWKCTLGTLARLDQLDASNGREVSARTYMNRSVPRCSDLRSRAVKDHGPQ